MSVTISAFLGALIGAFLHKAYTSYQEAKNAASQTRWFCLRDQKAHERLWKYQWVKRLVTL